MNEVYLIFTVCSYRSGKRKKNKRKFKKIEKATLISFAWGLFLFLQIIKSTAEIFRTSGLFLVQKGCYKHENLLHNGNSWCANTATPLEHPTGIHMQDSRAVHHMLQACLFILTVQDRYCLWRWEKGKVGPGAVPIAFSRLSEKGVSFSMIPSPVMHCTHTCISVILHCMQETRVVV